MTKTTKKPALAAANTHSDNKNVPGGAGPVVVKTGDFRTIAEVLDTRLPPGQQRRTAQSVLDPQSAASLAELRNDVHGENAKGHSLFLCAQCEQPVFVAQRPAAPDVPRNGDAAYFKHFSDKDARPCSWRTHNLHSIGAVQYNGQQEGLDHLTLKNALAECLRSDPRFTDVQVEKRITGKDHDWRVPDVSAVIDGKVMALDLQLPTLPISTILERAGFYEANDIHHVVLTDAVDDASIAASLSSGRFQLRELRIVPRLVPGHPVHNVWQSRLIGTDAILMDPGQRRKEGERQYSQTLMAAANTSFGPQRQAIRRAAAMNMGSAAVFEHWNHIARAIGGLNEDSAVAQCVGTVLAFLAQVEICCNGQRPMAHRELQQRLKTLLDGRHALHWAPLVVQVLKGCARHRASHGPRQQRAA